MKVIDTIAGLRQALLEAKRDRRSKSTVEPTVGFMPTLGYMHEGHVSLIKRARQECDIVVVSIFVNPLQFGANEDFDKYPRDHARDTQLAEQAGTDFIFIPSVKEMYPTPIQSKVAVTGLTDVMCGASRPGHFDGVATVVTKLFQIVQPDRAYFGQKDAQQVAVIEQMVVDLNMPVQIIPCPTLREADGLAMSSRNVYLSQEERQQAVVLSQALNIAEDLYATDSSLTPESLRNRIIQHIQSAPIAIIDYVDIRTYPSLQQVENFTKEQRIVIALAVKFGKTRLIDNTILNGR
jgi:pantoate--beta-alanine ligase